MDRTAAVIDTGTNSTRLLIAAVHESGLTEIVRRTRITRLGEGVDASGHLDAGARSRVEACVEEYAALIEAHGAATAILIATSSVRDAADGTEFMNGLADRHGFTFRLLDGDQEARLAFRGAVMGVPARDEIMMFDIGGGSTEIVVGSQGHVSYSRSLQLGCVRIREKFLLDDPPGPGQLDNATGFIDEQLAAAMPPSIAAVYKVLAVAGTMTTLAAWDLGLERYDRHRVHGHVLTSAGVDEMYGRLSAMTAGERMEISVIEAGRADVIVAGALIASRMLKIAGIPAVTISETDILEGALMAYGKP
ncbi:MAG: Ppx/GppA phosphatase family protein [Thermoleophilia bacterium]